MSSRPEIMTDLVFKSLKLVERVINRFVKPMPKCIPIEHNRHTRGILMRSPFKEESWKERLHVCSLYRELGGIMFNSNLDRAYIITDILSSNSIKNISGRNIPKLMPVEYISKYGKKELMVNGLNMKVSTSSVLTHTKQLLYNIVHVTRSNDVTIFAVSSIDKHNFSNTVLYYETLKFSSDGRIISTTTIDVLESLVDIHIEKVRRFGDMLQYSYNVKILDFNVGMHITPFMKGIINVPDGLDPKLFIRKKIMDRVKELIFTHKFKFIK